MNSAATSAPRAITAEKPPAKTADPPRVPRPRTKGPRIPNQEKDREAMLLCAAILEVLGGMRTPTQAAEALGVSVPRYYALESRALGGLLEACRKRHKGRRRTPERELSNLQEEVERLKRDCTRSQALLRTAQRALGLSPPRPATKPEEGATRKRRRRRPTARALRAAKVLSTELPGNSVESSTQKPQDAAEVK